MKKVVLIIMAVAIGVILLSWYILSVMARNEYQRTKEKQLEKARKAKAKKAELRKQELELSENGEEIENVPGESQE